MQALTGPPIQDSIEDSNGYSYDYLLSMPIQSLTTEKASCVGWIGSQYLCCHWTMFQPLTCTIVCCLAQQIFPTVVVPIKPYVFALENLTHMVSNNSCSNVL